MGFSPTKTIVPLDQAKIKIVYVLNQIATFLVVFS